MTTPIFFFILIQTIISTKVLWSQDIPDEYFTDDEPRDYNYYYNENLELHELDDDYDRVHMRGFGSNVDQDEYEDANSFKRDGWEIVE